MASIESASTARRIIRSTVGVSLMRASPLMALAIVGREGICGEQLLLLPASGGLELPQIVRGDVAANAVALSGILPRRLLPLTDRPELPGAAGVEAAAGRRVRKARDVAPERDARPGIVPVDCGNGRQQRFGVGMFGAREDRLGVPDLHELRH